MNALRLAPGELIERLVPRTVRLLETEYPNGIRLTLTEAAIEPIAPSAIYPAFYGCYDWHSSVHSHWQVVRALRLWPDAPFATDAVEVLDRLLNPANIAVEMHWVDDRPGFEMPYGMAWLLRLARELADWDDGRAVRWRDALRPLAQHAERQFAQYCSKLTRPQRGGMHNQSAFSLGLVWDSVPDHDLRASIEVAARRFFAGDTDIDLRFEPSAADFLSPSLSEADLMRRVLPDEEFVAWLERFAPRGFGVLRPVEVIDPSNGQLAHWAGLNLSRSWMMNDLAESLPADYRFVDGLRSGAAAHASAGLAIADHDAYMISHWVPTFAVYLLTGGEP